MAGRGRPRTRFYFTDFEEEAIVRYLETDDLIERNAIYNECLRYALDKLVECVLGMLAKKWGQQRVLGSDDYEQVHKDTLSYLTTVEHRYDKTRKSNKYKNENRDTKAFSYYSMICKNYVLGLLIAREKGLKKSASMDDFMSNVHENKNHSYNIDDVDVEPLDIIRDASNEIRLELLKNEQLNDIYLTSYEKRVGESLIFVLDNWQKIVDSEHNNKYYKSIILSYLRELTLLSSKDIRMSLIRFRMVYKSLINRKIKKGLM